MKFSDINIFQTFEPNAEKSDYALIEPEQAIIDQFKADVSMLESFTDYLLCCRGDSKGGTKKHNEFINNGLASLFMLGAKANAFYEQEFMEIMNPVENSNKKELLDEINQLLFDIEEELRLKNKEDYIGNIDVHQMGIELEKQSIPFLNQFKIFLISWRHNIGKGNRQKKLNQFSPIVSLTYGDDKYNIASCFARKYHRQGLIYLVYLDKRSKAHFRTCSLNEKLKQWKISWHADVHSEVMLVSGILSYHMMGIIEVYRSKAPRLIINPWLYKVYKEGDKFEPKNGIPVDQTNSFSWFDRSSYQQLFIETPEKQQYTLRLGPNGSLSKNNVFEKI
jgi:hypothetical protein